MGNVRQAGAPEAPTAEVARQLYRTMLRIRRFEEKIIEVYGAQDMKSPVHLCIGQEAIAAGVCACLRPDDYLFTTHRGHGHCLAKGVDPRVLYAEFYGRRDGCAGGRGGSMHPVAPECGVLGTSAIVGGAIPIAVGAALAATMQGTDRVAAVFFGDGATDEGTFHESLNFAALKKLPVLFVCENNFYAVNSHVAARQPSDSPARYAAPHGIPGVRVDGTDAAAVYVAARTAVERARTGGGPTLLECRAYRWQSHVGPEHDYEKGCRPKEEFEEWRKLCPVETFAVRLTCDGTLSAADSARMRAEIDDELAAALEFGRQSPFPEAAEVTRHVYREA